MITSTSFGNWLEKIKLELIALEKMRATWNAGTNAACICWTFTPAVRLLDYRAGHH